MKEESMYDVVIVGGGSMGIATAYYLAKQKKRVLVIDQFSIPNSYGSHHGHTRILRLGYGNGGKYAPLAIKSLELWRELEKESGKVLYKNTGAISIGHPNSRFVKEAIDSSIKYNVKYQEMDAESIMKLWPGIQIPHYYIGCYDPDSGFLFSEECILTYKEQSIKQGVTISENNLVQDIDIKDDYVEVITNKSTYFASKVIVTAGAWLSKLLTSIDLPIQPVRKTIAWFQPTEQQLYSDNFPCFVFDTELDGHYYGFPDFDGSGVKIGRMDSGNNIDPDNINRQFGNYEDDEGDVRSFLEKYMPQAVGKFLDGKVCMFANTPDSDFIVDCHPIHSHVFLAGGFSGHGFKFASVIGSILCDLATKGKTNHDISFLSLERFIQASL